MRFDDMAATVIAQAGENPAGRNIAWRQLVDLAAQDRFSSEGAASVYRTLSAWRDDVPQAARMQAVNALFGRRIPVRLFRFFAEDSLQVVAPLVRSIALSDEDWIGVLPELSPSVRALLRHRRDLSADVQRALDSFGTADMLIASDVVESAASEPQAVSQPRETAPEEKPAPAPEGTTQIRELVDRIEAYRRDHPVLRPFRAPPETPPEDRTTHFRFETGADGVIIWVDGAMRSPLVGTTIATTADTPDQGVDGYAAGAFRRRAPFRDARLTVPGQGAASGEWRISAVPFFTPHDGRFTGYRGIARRPRVDEVARTTPDGLHGSSLRPESLRQLVHELRTPLNAILGFAEMIDGQMLGPAAQDYRARALDIAAEARRLIGAVDDLDTAARVGSNALRLERRQIDGVDVLTRICTELSPLSADRGVHLHLDLPESSPPLSVDSLAIERMFSRLLAAVIAVSSYDEKLHVQFEPRPEARVELRVNRPRALVGQEERALLDPGYSPDGDWPDAPLLGLGFALRLVRNLAEAAGGKFLIGKESFALILPCVTDVAEDSGQSGL